MLGCFGKAVEGDYRERWREEIEPAVNSFGPLTLLLVDIPARTDSCELLGS